MEKRKIEPICFSSVIHVPNLWSHQREEALHHSYDPKRILVWEPRVGKTRTSLAQARQWLDAGINRIIIVAPQTVCGTVWEPEVRAAFPNYENKRSVKTVPLYAGTIQDRKAILRQLTWRRQNCLPEAVIVIVNRDALHYLVNELAAFLPEGLILDELHDYKTPSSQRHRAAERLAKCSRFIRGLTGTPTPKNYGDIYGQWKIVAPVIFGTNQNVFREQYLWCDPRFPSRVIGCKDIEGLKSKAFSVAGVKKRSECFDIPQVQEITRKVDLSPKVKETYRKIVKDHIFENGGKLLSLDHTLARLTVLQQIAGGNLPSKLTGSEEGQWFHDDLIDAALDEINDIIESGKKVVVFHRFIAEGHRLYYKLGPGKSGFLHGKTSPNDRTKMIEQFQKCEFPQVLICQESVGSVGVSFAAADYCIFYSCGLSNGVHTQARDRIFKPGGNLTYIYLQAKGTVHSWVRGILKSNQNASEVLLNMESFEKAAFGEEE